MFRLYASIGALLGLIAVALAAYASHAALAAVDMRRIVVAIAMQATHALLLLLIAAFLRAGGGALLHASAMLTIAGVLVFCGSLYGAVFAGWPTALAPSGGVALMLGWLLIAIAALGLKR